MVISIIFFIIFFVVGGFFVAAERSLVQLSGSQLEEKNLLENRTSILIKEIIDNIDKYLTSIRICIVISLILCVLFAENAYYLICKNLECLVPNFWGYALFVLILTVLILIFGIIVPNSLAAHSSETTARIAAYPVRFFFLIFSPLVWLINFISKNLLKIFKIEIFTEQKIYTQEELKYLIEQASEQVVDNKGDTQEENAKLNIIKNAFEFSQRNVRQVMVPRTQMLAIDLEDYDKKTIEHVIDEGFSRIPCYEDSVDNIVGMVHLKDILKELRKKENIDLKTILRTVAFVPESKRIVLLLSEFQQKHQQMAMVVNEYGGIEGLITMEDILEELVGEIQDESDNEMPFVQQVGEKTYHILATSAISDINEALPYHIDREKQYDTLAGYLIDKFGKIPLLNDKLIAENYEFVILKKSKTSIILVEAHILPNENEE